MKSTVESKFCQIRN